MALDVGAELEEVKLYFRAESFWGHDRMPLLEERLAEAGLRR